MGVILGKKITTILGIFGRPNSTPTYFFFLSVSRKNLYGGHTNISKT
jgi:hypothetical protein